MQDEEKCTKAIFREVLKLAVKALLKGKGVGDNSVIKCADIEQVSVLLGGGIGGKQIQPPYDIFGYF